MSLGTCPKCWENNCVCREPYTPTNIRTDNSKVIDTLQNKLSKQQETIKQVRELLLNISFYCPDCGMSTNGNCGHFEEGKAIDLLNALLEK